MTIFINRLKNNPKLRGVKCFVLIALVAAVTAVALNNGNPTSSVKTGENKNLVLPEGKQAYKISQAAEAWPKFIEATIDPVDVHVGDTQRLSVSVDDDVNIVSVEAHIETDNDVVILPLKFAGSESEEIIEKKNIFEDLFSRFRSVPKQPGVSSYEGDWIVKDTHNDTYHTVFIAKDAAGRENTIILAWSDACGIPVGGNFTLSSNCVISSNDGVDNGNLIINPGVTLTLNSTFAFNSGKTITVNGAIAKGAGGILKKTNIWMVDVDNDNYPASSTQYLQDTAPTNGKRRNTLNAGGIDCNDNSASVYPGTVTTGSCSCNYSSTCSESASGTTTTSTCSSDGTFTGGSGSCNCSRDTDGNSCGSGDYCSGGSCVEAEEPCGGGCGISWYCNGCTHMAQNYNCVDDECVAGTLLNYGCSTGFCGCECCSSSDCGSGETCSGNNCICSARGSWSCLCNDGYEPSGSLGAGVECRYGGGPETCLSRCSSHGGWSGSWSCEDAPC